MSDWGTGKLDWLPESTVDQPDGLSVEIGSWGGHDQVVKLSSEEKVMNLYVIHSEDDIEVGTPWSESSMVMFITVKDGELLATSTPNDQWGIVTDSHCNKIDPDKVNWEDFTHLIDDIRDENGNSQGYEF